MTAHFTLLTPIWRSAAGPPRHRLGEAFSFFFIPLPFLPGLLCLSRPRDEALTDIVDGIGKVAEELLEAE